MIFTTIEAEPGDSVHLSLVMLPAPVSADPDEALRRPVYETVIAGLYTNAAVVFPEWSGSAHDSWPRTVPGHILTLPPAGHSALALWSAGVSDPSHGLFLLTGRMPTYTGSGERIAGVRPWGFLVSPGIRSETGSEVILSSGFVEGGVSSGEMALGSVALTLDVSARIMNPFDLDLTGFRSDMSDWQYDGYDSPQVRESSVSAGGRQNPTEASLAELGLNIGISTEERFQTGISLHAGNSDVHFSRHFPVLPENGQIGTPRLLTYDEQHDASYLHASVKTITGQNTPGTSFRISVFVIQGSTGSDRLCWIFRPGPTRMNRPSSGLNQDIR
jgi:hypothetical protein